MRYRLDPHDLSFPHPKFADADGLLALGGDLKSERLLRAYKEGIFPWYSDETPILWYSPHERFVIPRNNIKVSKSMKQIIRAKRFSYTYDQAFSEVINACASVDRKEQDGTWIVNDMIRAYNRMHKLGHAHSIEVWNGNNELVGGLYGIKIGSIFSGESMFSKEANASKFALIQLATQFNISLIDCQVHSEHLESMGAYLIPQEVYLQILEKQNYTAHDLQNSF